MRKLSMEELRHGMYVQCPDLASVGFVPTFGETVYRIWFEDGGTFYTVDGHPTISKMDGRTVLDVWWETEKTRQLNREAKLKEIGI